jgi:DNA-binding NarL/FixJ family response regulator
LCAGFSSLDRDWRWFEAGVREGPQQGAGVFFRILVADDHDVMRKALRAKLEAHVDWQVCAEAANGLEAVQKAAQLKPDIIILDLAMPEMDGLQAAQQIFSASPEVPILIYTAHAFSPEANLEARKIGVRDVINKGGSPNELTSAVEALLGQKPPSEAVATAIGQSPGAGPRRRPGQA